MADTSIYRNLLRPVRSPDEVEASLMQRDMMQQNMLMARQQMADRQEATQRKNALMSIYASGKTGDDLANAVLAAGDFDAYSKLRKDSREATKLEAETASTQALTKQREVDTKRKLYEYGVQQIQGAPDVGTALRMLNQGVSAGAWGMQDAQASIQALQQAAQSGNPQALMDWKQSQLRTILAPKDLLPKSETRDAGGTVQTLSIDPVTGKPSVVGSIAKTMTPDQIEDNKRGWATLAETKRAHNMADSRARDGIATQQQMGRIPQGYRLAADGQSLEAIPGGPAATGKALPTKLVTDLSEQAQIADSTARFKNTFNDQFGGKTILGDASNVIGRVLGDDTGQAQWWQDYALHESTIRNKLFGASLTPGEQGQWQKLTVTPRMDPKQIRENLMRRAEIEERALARLTAGSAAAGYNREQIEAVTGRSIAPKAATVVPPAAGSFSDADKERRYQEWKKKQTGGK